jgi:hypothetical protein
MSPKVNRVIKTASFPGRYDHLIKINEFVTQAANNIGFKDDAIYAIQMAVDEAPARISSNMPMRAKVKVIYNAPAL